MNILGPNQNEEAVTYFNVKLNFPVFFCVAMDFSATCHPAPGKVDLTEEYTYGPKKSLRNSRDVRKRTM